MFISGRIFSETLLDVWSWMLKIIQVRSSAHGAVRYGCLQKLRRETVMSKRDRDRRSNHLPVYTFVTSGNQSTPAPATQPTTGVMNVSRKQDRRRSEYSNALERPHATIASIQVASLDIAGVMTNRCVYEFCFIRALSIRRVGGHGCLSLPNALMTAAVLILGAADVCSQTQTF